jgi:hypothetical protein
MVMVDLDELRGLQCVWLIIEEARGVDREVYLGDTSDVKMRSYDAGIDVQPDVIISTISPNIVNTFEKHT